MTVMFESVRTMFKKRVAELQHAMEHTTSNDEYFRMESEIAEIYEACQAMGSVESGDVVSKYDHTPTLDFDVVMNALTGLYEEVKRNGMGIGRQYRQAAGQVIEKYKK